MSPNPSKLQIVRLWSWLQNTSVFWRSLILIAIYVIVAIALEQIAYIFRSGEQVQPWDPAAGWNFVFLFGFGLRYGLAIPLVSIIESFALRPNETLSQGIINGIYVAIFVTGCSALLLYKLDLDPRLSRLQDIVNLTVVSFFGSLGYGITDITILLAQGKIERSEWFVKVMHEWAGEATGIAMLAPPLLILLRKFPWSNKRLDIKGAAPDIDFRLSQLKDIKEWLGLFAITILFTWLAHGKMISKGLDYTYFSFVPLTLVCAWKGFESTTVVIVSINIMTVIFVGKNAENTFALQFGLMTVTYVGLLLSAFVSARNRESTQKKDLEEKLRYDATHDNLTGLYNRAWFLDRLEQIENKAAENEDYLFAVLFLDLDRFKTVNDSFGHAVGDRLLVQIAQKLRECLPENSPVARLGSDEFTIVLEELKNVDRASQIAKMICQRLGQTYIVDGYEVFITASVGIAFNSEGYRNRNLLRNADIALYEAKARGKDGYVVFDDRMYDQAIGRAQLEQDFRQAVNELNN